MGELWMLWLGGLVATIGGVLLFIYRDLIHKVMFSGDPIFDRDGKGPSGDGSFFILPAIMAPPLGLLFLFFAADRTFGWGMT